jgi:hypothetical protein
MIEHSCRRTGHNWALKNEAIRKVRQTKRIENARILREGMESSSDPASLNPW